MICEQPDSPDKALCHVPCEARAVPAGFAGRALQVILDVRRKEMTMKLTCKFSEYSDPLGEFLLAETSYLEANAARV